MNVQDKHRDVGNKFQNFKEEDEVRTKRTSIRREKEKVKMV